MIARLLGAEDYGAFTSMVALAGIFAPFSSLGTEITLIKNTSRDPSKFRAYWGNALLITLTLGLIITIAIFFLSRFLLTEKISPVSTSLIFLSELISLKVMTISGNAFMAIERLSKTAQIEFMMSAKNLTALLGLLVFLKTPTLNDWVGMYTASSLLFAGLAAALVYQTFGRPSLHLPYFRQELREGLYFAVNDSAQTVFGAVDQTMLARFSTLQATGIYSAAYKLIIVAFVPIQALLATTYSRFFHHGAVGLSETARFAKKLVPYSLGYGIAACLGLVVIAPFLPLLLGDTYRDVVGALRWLAPVLIFRATLYFAGDTLTGAGFQGIRTLVQVLFAGFNVCLNLYLIPIYSWKGAAWATLASELLMMLSLWLIIAVLLKRQQLKA